MQVISDGRIHTPPNGHSILPGTTRDVVSELALRLNIDSRTGRVPEPMLRSAEEIWLGSATRGVLPVTTLDGKAVGSGRPGPVCERMRAAFLEYIRELAGTAPL